MIGSHNSFTYLPATNRWMNWFSFLWRCQSKSILDQYNIGVGYFDIRVKLRDKKWVLAHGLVDLDKSYSSLKDLTKDFVVKFPKSKFRLILEDNRKSSDIRFLTETRHLVDQPYIFNRISLIVIKRNWEILYIEPKAPAVIDYCYVPWHSGWSFWENIKHFTFSTIKRWAKKHNPTITPEMIAEPNTVYFMDYI